MLPWRIERYELLGSTSELCRERAAAGEAAGLVVIAERQGSGRASFGRAWSSPPGNLYLSVLLRPSQRLAMAGLFPLLSAVVLADTVAPLLPDPAALTLKWPNDLLLNGGKLAGILLDSAPDGAGGFASLVIGFGLNILTKPDIPDRPTACLADAVTPPPSPDAVADRLLAALVARLDTPPDLWRHAWLARGPAIGTPLRLHQGTISLTGHFAGLADDGRILLDIDGTISCHATGEIRIAP